MGKTMNTLKKHRGRLYNKLEPQKTYVRIDDGKYNGNKGIVWTKTNPFKTKTGYFSVTVLLENDELVEVGGDDIDIISVWR
jgi:hypothetical protein